jgi:lipopolysaccharide/colanic/teichoic acid biosynthesis glycosyltransferase
MRPQLKPVELAADYEPSIHRRGRLQRAFDIACSISGLAFLSPIFCFVAIAIKLDDRGPVFYRQTRVGRGLRTFQLWKFRTMVRDADRLGLLTTPDDRRVTRTGRWLRRHKLDELPQLLNVLAGDMQLVGARPEVERYVAMFRSEYGEILRDRPGITDPAAIAYRREEQWFVAGQIEKQYVEDILPAKLKLSMGYQTRRTFWSDVRVLLQTVFGTAR